MQQTRTDAHRAPTLSVAVAVADVLVMKAVAVEGDPALGAGLQQEQADGQQGAQETEHDAVRG